MNRQEGYYWVKFYDSWHIAVWNLGTWHITAVTGQYSDSDMGEINESRIPSPDEILSYDDAREVVADIARSSHDADGCFDRDWFSQSFDHYDFIIVEKKQNL